MHTQNRNLNDLFSQARDESSFVTGEEIDALLDAHDLHGRQFDVAGEGDRPHSKQPYRGIVMGILTTAIIGGIIGAGTFFWNSDGAGTESPGTPEADQQSMAAVPSPGWAFTGIPGSLLTAPTRVVSPVSTKGNRPVDLRLQRPEGNAPSPISQLDGRDGNEPDQKTSEPTDEETRQEELSRQLGQFVTDYWYNRINDYRQFIDRSLNSTDRAELNRLRVRWELLDDDGDGMLELHLGARHVINRDGANVDVSNTMGWNHRDGGGMQVLAKIGTSLDSLSDDLDKMALAIDADADDIDGAMALAFINSNNADDTITLQNINREMNIEIETNAESDGDTEKRTTRIRNIVINRDGTEKEEVHTLNLQNLDMLDEGSIGDMLKMAIAMDPSDRSEILRETWEIADRNRTDLDALKERVMSDVRTFSDELQTRLRRYAVASDPEHAEQISAALDNGEDLTEPIFSEVLGPLYDVIAEPMLMLYNGSDITKMLSSGITEPVAGIQLDGSSALAQSYPNPASTHATIDYRLNEASSSTTLRLFDITGNEVLRKDLGSVEKGDHSYDIDISTMPSGTYLYHLTVETPEGSRVWSRSMEIQR